MRAKRAKADMNWMRISRITVFAVMLAMIVGQFTMIRGMGSRLSASEQSVNDLSATVAKMMEDREPAIKRTIEYKTTVAYIRRNKASTVPDSFVEPMAMAIVGSAIRNNIGVDVAVAVTHVESIFTPWETSVVGALGLMQLRPKFWIDNHLGERVADLFDMQFNTNKGCEALAMFISRHGLKKGLSCYNVGPSGRYNAKYVGKVESKMKDFNRLRKQLESEHAAA